MKTKKTNVSNVEASKERRNVDVQKALAIRHITVQTELHDPDQTTVYKGVWDNGHDPLEIHVLDAKNMRDALLEAEGIVEVNGPEVPATDRSFRGVDDTAANKNPDDLKDQPTKPTSDQDQIEKGRVAVGSAPGGGVAGKKAS